MVARISPQTAAARCRLNVVAVDGIRDCPGHRSARGLWAGDIRFGPDWRAKIRLDFALASPPTQTGPVCRTARRVTFTRTAEDLQSRHQGRSRTQDALGGTRTAKETAWISP